MLALTRSQSVEIVHPRDDAVQQWIVVHWTVVAAVLDHVIRQDFGLALRGGRAHLVVRWRVLWNVKAAATEHHDLLQVVVEAPHHKLVDRRVEIVY